MQNAVDTSHLRANVRFLGETLGDIIRTSAGDALFDQVEAIRLSSKNAQADETLDALYQLLRGLEDQTILLIARAFSQFLNLANIADQHHTTATGTTEHFSARASLERAVTELSLSHSREALSDALNQLSIDLVLTAHPTEITRRTLIHKHREISHCLTELDRNNLKVSDDEHVRGRIVELVAQIWHTEEFRSERPSPVDEARWGFAVIENSLWDAVPQFLRDIDAICAQHDLPARALDWQPIQISSWIGGDRDGNPNVTAQISRRVLLLAQWEACDLLYRDLRGLYEELSLTNASATLQRAAGHTLEPYRSVLKPIHDQLKIQRRDIDRSLQGEIAAPASLQHDDILRPLILCYESLIEQGVSTVARGRLLDTIRRAYCFGPHLIKLDIRQESTRHSKTIAAVTQQLGLGDYLVWSETERQAFLRAELINPRPLIPSNWQPEPDVQEVLDTFSVIAETPSPALGCYVISMASSPSDVLAVQLLLKATGCPINMPVSPLFETLSDLNNARDVVVALLDDDEYRARIDKHLVIMIGYSDSAKDAGMMAAGWAQYRAQEALISVCDEKNIKLQLFHGRGGSIGRGGAPAHQALLSQPPRSLLNGLRVTEQGEMIRTKLGLTPLATNTLGQYASAILRANLSPPPAPQTAWRALMDKMSAVSCDAYRGWVRDEANFVAYFRQATPEQELASLPLGSRPARRRSGGGIESLRAIPWIFAWSQNRLMLPAWLGAGNALSQMVTDGEINTLRAMVRDWPFFAGRLSMLEMVFAKADISIASLYDRMLVIAELKPIGNALRQQLVDDQATLLKILQQECLLEHDSWAMESINLRNVYTAPLNLLQAELLRRVRETHDPAVEQALMVSIAGVAAGMRNTG